MGFMIDLLAPIGSVFVFSCLFVLIGSIIMTLYSEDNFEDGSIDHTIISYFFLAGIVDIYWMDWRGYAS